MDKYKIIVLCGEAGVGKDFLKNKALEECPDIFHRVITATTRPMRDGEINGKDYYFLTEEEFSNLEMIESCCFNNWYYGTPINSLSKDKVNLMVLNPSGIYQLLKEKDKYDTQIIRLKTDDKERLKRQLDREAEPNVDEIVRRYIEDKKDFSVFDAILYDEMAVWHTDLVAIDTMLDGLVALASKRKYEEPEWQEAK